MSYIKSMAAEEIRHLEELCRKNPDDPEALLRLAEAHEQGGNLGKALLTYAQAIHHDWSAAAWVDFHVRCYSRAMESMQRILHTLEERARLDPAPETRAYLACAYAQTGRMAEALEKLKNHQWPGNIRELKNVLLRSIYTSQDAEITPRRLCFFPTLDSFVEEAKEDETRPHTLEAGERHIILSTLNQCGGNKKKTADTLGIAKSTLFKKLKEYDIL